MDIKDAKDVICDECGSLYFKKALRFKKMSKILTGSLNDEYIPIPVTMCVECNHVNEEFEIDKKIK